MQVEANRQFEPDADRTDPSKTATVVPFVFVDAGDVAGYYISLARFLAGEYVHRLKKCQYCRGLFIAPDNRKHAYCPGTDHRKRHWNEDWGREYHRQDMAERRTYGSSKFDPKYIRE